MGKKIERIAVGTLVFSVSILTFIGLLAIWEWILDDILWKSYSTIGVIGVTALIVIGISRVMSMYSPQPQAPEPESPLWRSARNAVLGVLGVGFLLFAGMSILSIWDVVEGGSLMKAISSMGLLACSGLILLVAFKSQLDQQAAQAPQAPQQPPQVPPQPQQPQA